MSTYTQILYHIVFSTKNRKNVISYNREAELHSYLSKVLMNHDCFVYLINGTSNHLHIATHIHPKVALSGIIKDLKLSSSKWIKSSNVFPFFEGWQKGYGAFTTSIAEKDNLYHYIANQKKHHKIKSFNEEFIELLEINSIKFDTKFLL